jgi:hypothetical protein
MTAERWVSIPDWPEYSVSSYGRIRSEPRWVYRPAIKRGYRVRGRVLKPNRQGCVNLSRRGARRSAHCRSMAAEVFGWGRRSDVA